MTLRTSILKMIPPIVLCLVATSLASSCASKPISYDRRMIYLEDRIETLERQGWVTQLTPDEFERGQAAYAQAVQLIEQRAPDREIVNAISRSEISLILAENRAKNRVLEHGIDRESSPQASARGPVEGTARE